MQNDDLLHAGDLTNTFQHPVCEARKIGGNKNPFEHICSAWLIPGKNRREKYSCETDWISPIIIVVKYGEAQSGVSVRRE
ncbi:MAG: hypothetical protein ABSE74_06345 [Methanoregula sp.]|jgi:hypothetical protein